MDDTTGATVSETTGETNGSTPPPSVKQWIAAGFKTRDEWRTSLGKKTSKKPKAEKAEKKEASPAKPKKAKKKAAKKVAKKAKVKAAAAKSKAKKKVKKVAKLKAAGKSKGKAKRKVSAPKKGSVKDASMKPVPVGELSTKCKKVFLAVGKGKTATIAEIQKKACPNLPHAKGNSVVRNQLRFLRVHRMVKLLGGGEYRRTA